MTYEEQVARATRICVGFVTGKRTITRNHTAEPDKRDEGRIDNTGYHGRVWRGGNHQEVIESMEKVLGPVDWREYHIEE
jgi:hypothetical protein